MATRRYDPRIIELDDLNPTKYHGNVIERNQIMINCCVGFTVWGLYYLRGPYGIPPIIISHWFIVKKFYETRVSTKALRKKQYKDNAWRTCTDLSWPKTLFWKQVVFGLQCFVPFSVGALLARRLMYRHLSPAFPRPPTPAPYPVTPKGFTDTRVH